MHYMKKQTVCFLLLLPALAVLRAQHTYRVDSLGISVAFPCIPEDFGNEETELGNGIKLQGAKCRASPGEVYMFAHARVSVAPSTKEMLKLYLKGTQTGFTNSIKARSSKEKIKPGIDQGWLQYRFKSKTTGLSGFALIICDRNEIYQLVYLSNSHIDKKGWARFRSSLQGLAFY